MDSQNIAREGVKHRRVNSSPDQNQRLPRKKVHISGDTWLEALKFMTCPQWMQKRYVNFRINGIAERNISRFPKMILDLAIMYRYEKGVSRVTKGAPIQTVLEEPQVNKYTIVAFDTVMQKEQSTEWFKNRGFTFDTPVGIPPENALLYSHEWTRNLDSSINILILGSAQEKIPLSEEENRFPWFDIPWYYEEQFRKPVLYYAQFNPVLNQYSWDYLAQFLKLLYHPTSYVKEIDMFPVNQNFIDSHQYKVNNVDNGPRYIQCASFVVKMRDANVVHLTDIFKWTIQNVRAETIHITYNDNENLDLLSNFVFDASGANQCASMETLIYTCRNPATFLITLIEKFHTIPLVESAIPTLSCYMDREKLPAHLGPNLIAREVDSEGADALYMISNGQNRMRISFCWEEFDDESDDDFTDCIWDDDFTCRVRIYSV